MKNKQFIAALILVVLSLGFACLSNAQDCQQVGYADIKVTFTPSPDARAIGHVVYYYHVDNDMEYNSGAIPLGTSEYFIEKGKLWPGHTYVFTASAYSETSESVRSEPLRICINDLPPFNPPGKKEPVNWIDLLPPGILKQIFGN